MRPDFTLFSFIFYFGILALRLWKILPVSIWNRDMRGISLFRSRSRPEKDSSPGRIPILLLSHFHPNPRSDLILVSVLIPPWSWFWFRSYLTPISVLLLSRFHTSPASDPVPTLSLSRSYRGSIPIPSGSYPRSGEKQNFVVFQVRMHFDYL